jgi:hypothetical protein
MTTDEGGWISIERRLPRIRRRVLLYRLADEEPGATIFIGWREKNDEDGQSVWSDEARALVYWLGGDVTHWCPLPARPRRLPNQPSPSVSGG